MFINFFFFCKNTTGMSKVVIFVFNGKIKVKIVLHVPKTTIKEPPLVLHTAIHEWQEVTVVLSHTFLLFCFTIVLEGTKHV